MISKDLLNYYQPVFVVSVIRALGVDLFVECAQKYSKSVKLDDTQIVFQFLVKIFTVFEKIIDCKSLELDKTNVTQVWDELFFETLEDIDESLVLFVLDSYLKFLDLWLEPMHDSYDASDLEAYLALANGYSFEAEFRKIVDARFLFPFIVDDNLQIQFDKKIHDFIDEIEDDSDREAAIKCVNRLLDECFCMKMDFVYK